MAKYAYSRGLSCRPLLCSLRFFWLIGLALLLQAQAEAHGSVVSSGHSGHWFNLERAGEGLVLEIMSPELALLYWFTYDEEGYQRWLTNVGHIDGARIVFDELLVTRGGRFGPDFDPDEVELEVVGQAELAFSDCDNMVFSYSAFGQSQSIEMIRLTQTMAAGCQPLHGVPGEPVRPYAGQSGSWLDPAHVGEGYTLQWMSRDQAVLNWFTYDRDGNQYWMIGTGEQVGEQIHFEMLHSARGGRFGEAFDSDEVELIEWGSLVMELGCLTGTAAYESLLPEFGSGNLELERLSMLKAPACPYQAPSFAELFELELETIPMHRADGEEANYNASGLADDGTVAVGRSHGGSSLEVLRWRPGDEYLQPLPPEGNFSLTNLLPLISRDGTTIAYNRATNLAGSPLRPAPLIQIRDEGWHHLSDPAFESLLVHGISPDGSVLVGQGRLDVDYGPGHPNLPWYWTEETGYVILPVEEHLRHGLAYAASSDGRIVVGEQREFGGAMGVFATRWVDGQPEILRDQWGSALREAFRCANDCQMIFGAGQSVQTDPEHLHYGQAWYWTETDGVVYLGEPHDAYYGSRFHIMNVSADGGIVAGSYIRENSLGQLNLNPFVWSQVTGMVSLAQELEDAGLWDYGWHRMLPNGVDSEGRQILLSGERPGTFKGRAVLLKLIEREQEPGY